MRPDYQHTFPRATRASHRDGTARTDRRVNGSAQVPPRQRPRFDQAHGNSPYVGDMTFNEDVMLDFDREEARHRSVRATSRLSSTGRPRERSKAFDVKSEHDLAVIIDAIRDAHRDLNIQQDRWSRFRQKRLEEFMRSETDADPAEEPSAQDNHPPERSEIEPRWWKRTRLWVGALMMVGAFVTGIYARDNISPIADSLQRDAKWLAHSALAVFEGGKGNDAPLYTGSLPRSRGISPDLLPDTYGLYAVSNGQLTRLEPLRYRVPDTRIALPGLVTKPSSISMPDGHLNFIAYQRDLRTNAPDNATIRVVAKVVRDLTFPTDGKPKATPIENTWTAREVSVDLTVAPVPGNQEMVMIQPLDPDLSLSPGRYMLVFKNQAYDFAVEGRVTDTAHCLERTETQTGGVYTECRQLP